MPTARGKRVGVASRCASRSKRRFAPTNANWSVTTCRRVWEEGNTNMLLFGIIGDSFEVVELATFIGIIIVCWTIYIVYTGGCSDL